jgi:hypothetical protein
MTQKTAHWPSNSYFDFEGDFIAADGRSGEIRTPDPLVPNQMRYQTALHSAAAMAVIYTDHSLCASAITPKIQKEFQKITIEKTERLQRFSRTHQSQLNWIFEVF